MGNKLHTTPSINFKNESGRNGREGYARDFELGDGREGKILWDGKFTGEGAHDLHLSILLKDAREQPGIAYRTPFMPLEGFRKDGEQAELLAQMNDDSLAAEVLREAGVVVTLPEQTGPVQIEQMAS